jgi:hypothetical protein
MASSYPKLILAGLFVVALCPGATGSDERNRERMRGDDDPIIVPRSVALPPAVAVTLFDPETTGSIDRRPVKVSRSCDSFGWYLDRAPDAQFQEAC